MMTLYPPLESGETHRLQHVAEVRCRLEKERDFISSTYKKYQGGANVAGGIDTALPALGCVAVNNHRGAFRHWSSSRGDCVWAARGRREIGRPEASSKSQKHDLIRGLAESKLNTIADRISVALNDDKITEEEFRLILSEVDKFYQMKNEIRGRQKQSGGLSEDKKKQTISACERRSHDCSPHQVVERNQSWNQQWHLNISC